ncbi:MAG: dihydrofolate reductase family protein [Parasphingopyxis sp.]|uniref:dihydrofolate reductase family protein n=1 Tax=Parasphingopyxis sp. TaxID=1920299 RepID=UPI003F9FD21F
MQSIIYDVAVSADGFIAGPDADISKFPQSSPAVDDYFERLKTYRSAIMGRATYEFGYDFGLAPGANPYPHMRTLVFSQGLSLPDDPAVEIVRLDALDHLTALRKSSDGPIYLCGGGAFAGWALSAGLIDVLRLKRAPIFLGSGTRLFGDHAPGCDAKLMQSKLYADGMLFQEFALKSRTA